MKLHRWVFISPGSHCLLMIIRVGGKFACSHAVNHFPQFFFSPALHHLAVSLPLSFKGCRYWRLSFTRCAAMCIFPYHPCAASPRQNEILEVELQVVKVRMQTVLSNQRGLMRIFSWFSFFCLLCDLFVLFIYLFMHCSILLSN